MGFFALLVIPFVVVLLLFFRFLYYFGFLILLLSFFVFALFLVTAFLFLARFFFLLFSFFVSVRFFFFLYLSTLVAVFQLVFRSIRLPPPFLLVLILIL